MEQTAKHRLSGEVAVVLATCINSFAVTLFVKSGFGLSVVSGVPYVLSLIRPQISLGTWTACTQCLWLLFLMISLRRFRIGYLLSFVVGAAFGLLLDFWAWALAGVPTDILPLRIAYFVTGFAAMSTGIALYYRCKLPALPVDTVPREYTLVKGYSVRASRTVFDMTNLLIMLALGLIFLGRPAAIGIGTILNALFMGSGAQIITRFLDRRFEIKPASRLLARLA